MQLTKPDKTTPQSEGESSKSGTSTQSSGSPTPNSTPTSPKNSSKLLQRSMKATEKTPFTKIMLYGDPGVGKTVSACRSSDPSKTVLFDTENGWLSLRNHDDLREKVEIIPISTLEDLHSLFTEVRAGMFDAFDTLVIDNITELSKRTLDERLRSQTAKDPTKYDPYLPNQQDYKWNTEALRRIFIALRDLPKNLVLVAHAVNITPEGSSVTYTKPDLTPKLSGTLTGMLDVVGYMTRTANRQGEKRNLQVQPSYTITAKTRIGGLPPIIEDPTFAMLQLAKKETESD